jgi:Conserved TM helix
MQTISDWGQALLTSFSSALALIFSFIPKLIGFLIILLIGWFVAKAIGRVVTVLLRKVGFDNFSNRIGLSRFDQRMGVHLDPADLLGQIVFWFVFLIFLVPALESLGLTSVTSILNQLIAYIPAVFVAILILFLGALIATVVADIVRGLTATARVGNPNVFAAIARWTIILFAVFMALSQLRIAPSIVELLFAAIVFGSALAFGLAFGLGGRDAAQRLIESGETTLNSAAGQFSTQQPTDQINTITQQTFSQDVRNVPQGAQDVRQQGQQTGFDAQQKAQDL